MKSYISRKLPLATRTTAPIFPVRAFEAMRLCGRVLRGGISAGDTAIERIDAERPVAVIPAQIVRALAGRVQMRDDAFLVEGHLSRDVALGRETRAIEHLAATVDANTVSARVFQQRHLHRIEGRSGD